MVENVPWATLVQFVTKQIYVFGCLIKCFIENLEAYFNSSANSQLIDSSGICITVNISTTKHQKVYITRYST